MLKEFAQYLVSLKDNKTYEINGQTYSDRELCRIAPHVDRPNKITVNGLDSVVKLIQREYLGQQLPLFVRVATPRDIEVFTALDVMQGRNHLYVVECDAPKFQAGWREYDTAIIELRSMFIPNDGTEYLLDLLSRISKEDNVTTSDNGVTQQVEARSGIALKAKETIRPRVKLIPYRTFAEVEQPESEFLLRVDDDARIGLFEADGGTWKLNAKANIAGFLNSRLETLVKDGYVVVML